MRDALIAAASLVTGWWLCDFRWKDRKHRADMAELLRDVPEPPSNVTPIFRYQSDGNGLIA